MYLNPRGSDQTSKEPRTWSEDSPCLQNTCARSDDLAPPSQLPPRSILMCRPVEHRRRVVHDRPGRAQARAGGRASATASTPAGLLNHTAAHRVRWSRNRPYLRRGGDITGKGGGTSTPPCRYISSGRRRFAHENLDNTSASKSHFRRPHTAR